MDLTPLPHDMIPKWEKLRARGQQRFVAFPVLNGTLLLESLLFLFSRHVLHLRADSPAGIRFAVFGVFLAIPCAIHILFSRMWTVAEYRYHLAVHPELAPQLTPPRPLEIAALRETPLRWSCAPHDRRVFSIIATLGTLALLMPVFTGLFDGTFVTVPVLLILALFYFGKTALEGGWRLNPRERHLVRWYGILFPWYFRRVPFSHVLEVHVSRGKYPGDMRTGSSWSHVAASTLGGMVLLKRFDYLPEAQRFAEQLTKALELDPAASIKEAQERTPT